MSRRTRKFFFDNIRGKIIKNTTNTVAQNANEGYKVDDFASNAVIHSTGSFSDVNTKMMTAAAIDDRIVVRTNELVDSAPETLNTLNELAAALGDDANYSTTTSTALGNRLRIDVNDQSLTSTQKSNAVTNLGLATVASSGAYSDLTGTPTIPTNNNQLTNGAGYSTFSGSYNDLSNKPTIPTNNNQLTNGAGYSTFSGAYADLTGKPTIPTNNNQLTNGAGYITSADGGNADTVDGIQGSSIMRLDASGTVPDGVIHTYECYGNIATSSGNQASLQCFNSGSGTDAFMTFHVGGDYAANLGVDGGINDLAYGGWSAGAVSHRVWHAGNDGSGSGLDADTVDGLQASSFITTDTTQSNSIWIRNASPTIYFRDTNHRGAMIHNNSNLLYVLRGSQATDSTTWATTGNGWPMTINLTNNDTTFAGNVTAYSDARLKENVEPIGISIDQFKSIEAKRFDWKIDGKHDIGFIAQDVEAAGLVEVVKEHEERDPETGDLIDIYKTLDYSRMVPFLWDIVQKQQKEIEELKEMIGGASE